MINRQTTDSKYLHEIMRSHTMKAHQNTMGTLANPVMLTLFIESAEYMLCFGAEVLNESHLQTRPL
jgi:hypothetical protein